MIDGRRLRRVAITDASSGRRDSFAGCVAGWNEVEADGRLFAVDWVEAVTAKRAKRLTASGVVEHFARRFKAGGVSTVFGDQRESFTLKSEFARHGLRFVEMTWTSSSKSKAVAHLRRWFSDGMIALPDHAELRRQLLSYEEHAASGGRLTYSHRGASHDDLVALLITAAMADMARRLPGSPGRESAYVRPPPGQPSAAALAGFVDMPEGAEHRVQIDHDLTLDDHGRLRVVPREERGRRATRSGNDWGAF